MLANPANDTPEAPSTRWERTLLLVVATAGIVIGLGSDFKKSINSDWCGGQFECRAGVGGWRHLGPRACL